MMGGSRGHTAKSSPSPWSHANKLGITLKSAPPYEGGRKRASSPTHTVSPACRKLSARTSPSTHTSRARSSRSLQFASPTPGELQYVQNIIVPIPGPHDDARESHQRCGSPRSGLPPMVAPQTSRTSMSMNCAPRSVSQCENRPYPNSMCGDSVLNAGRGESEASSANWNVSEQALRFEHERDNKQKTHTLRKNTQVQSHRIDRLYYMSGARFNLRPRYQVDMDDLERLREMTKSRTSQHGYGRGLSKRRQPGKTDLWSVASKETLSDFDFPVCEAGTPREAWLCLAATVRNMMKEEEDINNSRKLMIQQTDDLQTSALIPYYVRSPCDNKQQQQAEYCITNAFKESRYQEGCGSRARRFYGNGLHENVGCDCRHTGSVQTELYNSAPQIIPLIC